MQEVMGKWVAHLALDKRVRVQFQVCVSLSAFSSLDSDDDIKVIEGSLFIGYQLCREKPWTIFQNKLLANY